MKNSALHPQRGRHGLAVLEYALLLLVIGALALALWARFGRTLSEALRDESALLPPRTPG